MSEPINFLRLLDKCQEEKGLCREKASTKNALMCFLKCLPYLYTVALVMLSPRKEKAKKTLVNLSLDKNLETVLCSRHIVEKRTQYCHGLDGIIATHGST